MKSISCNYTYISTGDVILADRSFTCEKYAGMALAEVKHPPFTRGKKQLEKVYRSGLEHKIITSANSC